MQIHDQNEQVRQLQLALISRGYPLPRYGADGDFGNETADALERYARRRSQFRWDRSMLVPPELLDELGIDTEELEHVAEPCESKASVPMFDLRHEQRDPHPKGKVGRNGKTVVRSPGAITGIMLHQTDVEFGRPKSDPSDLGLARRSLGVACHAMAFRAGFFTLPAPPLWNVQHGNALNSSTLGVEVEGVYPRLRGRKPARGRTASPESSTTIEVACEALRVLVEQARALGCPIQYIYAHCQTDSWRIADPGEWLWRKVVLDYAVPALQLEIQPDRWWRHHLGRKRDGAPIPREWR